MPIKILIADNHTFFRESFRSRLSRFGSVEEIQEVTDPDFLRKLAANKRFDILFVDRNILGSPWEALFSGIVSSAKGGRVILLVEANNAEDIWQAFALGAQGCLTKDSADAQNINALRLIMDGVPYIPPAVLNGILRKKKPEKSVFPSGRRMTSRQREVLDLLSIGLSNKEIAHKIHVSEATVKLHINSLLRNLNVENRMKAVITAQKIGLL